MRMLRTVYPNAVTAPGVWEAFNPVIMVARLQGVLKSAFIARGDSVIFTTFDTNLFHRRTQCLTSR